MVKTFVLYQFNFLKEGDRNMSLCPVCGRALCDHTPEERGQTVKEMMRDLSTEEEAAWKNNPFNDLVKREVARKHVHDPV